MPRSPALALLLATPLLAGCAPDAPPWTATFGGGGQNNFVLLAIDPSGAVALAGTFQNDIDLGGGALHGEQSDDDVFVGMLDPSGKPLWSGATGSIGPQVAEGLAIAPDGSVILLGDFTNEVKFGDTKLTALALDAFLVKLDRGGAVQWVKHWSGDDGGPSGNGLYFPAGVAATSDGITFAGAFSGSVGFGGPPLDTPSIDVMQSFVARVDHDGRHVFSTSFGGHDHRINAVTVDGSGDIYVTGTNLGEIDIGGGAFTTTNGAEFVARLGPDGTPRWAFQVGSEVRSSGGPITVDANGNVLIAGSYSGPLEIERFKLDSDGANAFVLEVSADGEPLWIHNFRRATITGLAIDEAGKVVVGGSYAGTSNFGGGPLPHLDNNGAFITTLEPEKGKHVETLVLGLPKLANSSLTGLVISGKDAIVTGNFTGAIQLPDKMLMGPTDSGSGIDFVARLHL